ncbi:MAG: phosphate ABC transporter permease PstA [Thermomicrobiales bacterium]|nr:phosphate ABC transporter permease PstA [Thermomicrobiales bacterium]
MSGGADSVATDLLDSTPMRGRVRRARLFLILLYAAAAFTVGALGVLIGTTLIDGWRYLSLDLITNLPSRRPEAAGLYVALWGTVMVIGLTVLFAFPIGVGAAIYLEEYGPKNRLTKLLQLNISNLAGVPSIVYGLLGLGIFAVWFGLGRSLITGALTMALLILPIIIIAAQEALKAVPPSLREAAYGLGATKWQTTWHHVLPSAVPGILTGTILAVSRAIGETAPLLVAGASAFLLFKPTGLDSNYTVLPMQIYNWTSRPQQEFQDLAAAGIIVLLAVLLLMNSVAIIIRQRYSRKLRG